MTPNVDIALAYLRALETRTSFADVSRFFAPECVQEEFPNRLVPNGARRTVKDLEAASVRGRQVVENERFEVVRSISEGDEVALEVLWSARILVPLASLKPGDTMRARFGVFLTFSNGLIVSQRNYDCFDAF